MLVTAARPRGLATLASLRPGHNRFAYATGHAHVVRAGGAVVHVVLTKAGGALLKRDRKLGRALRFASTFSSPPPAGTPRS